MATFFWLFSKICTLRVPKFFGLRPNLRPPGGHKNFSGGGIPLPVLTYVYSPLQLKKASVLTLALPRTWFPWPVRPPP